ncbi:putative nucleotidyltransferase [Rossellomorea marisflavi]
MEEYATSLAKRISGIFRSKLTGVYLHGSLVMDCFHPEISDIDLLIVVEDGISKDERKALDDLFLGEYRGDHLPAKGLEVSVITKSNVYPLLYPTPFDYHFSGMHIAAIRRGDATFPATDPDIAAHIAVIRTRGRALIGEPIEAVFAPVPYNYYMKSIYNDIHDAEADILKQPTYMILNLCRVYQFCIKQSVASKKEGGEWGLQSLPVRFHPIIQKALKVYETGEMWQTAVEEEASLTDFAVYMTSSIREKSINFLDHDDNLKI